MIRRGGGGDLLVISISPLTSFPRKPLKQGAKSKGIEPEGEGWDPRERVGTRGFGLRQSGFGPASSFLERVRACRWWQMSRTPNPSGLNPGHTLNSWGTYRRTRGCSFIPSSRASLPLQFLISSLCLFMIEEEVQPERRELDLFMLTAPPGVRSQVRGAGYFHAHITTHPAYAASCACIHAPYMLPYAPPHLLPSSSHTRKQTWWTVNARAPEPDGVIDANQDRAISTLLIILGMHLFDT